MTLTDGHRTKREDFLDRLLSANDAPHALLDLDGRCLAANRAFSQALGRDAAEVEGKPLAAVVGAAALAEAVEAHRVRVAETGVTATLVGALAGIDVGLRPVRGADGAVTALAVVGEDAQLTQARRDTAQAQAATGRFLAKASHDLRQPFQAMHLFHHLLAGRQSDPSGIDLANKLGQSIQGAESLLNALLEVSRLEAGLVVAQPRAFPIDDTLSHLLQEFAPEAEAKGLRFNVRPAEVEVLSDPLLLERLLRPILANAVRYTRKGGILLATRRRPALVRIEVWDSGVGIDPANHAVIFEDFHRITHAELERRAAPGQGVGLGLGVVRRLARVLDLPVTVRSKPGRGAIFAVDVPRAPQHALAAHTSD